MSGPRGGIQRSIFVGEAPTLSTLYCLWVDNLHFERLDTVEEEQEKKDSKLEGLDSEQEKLDSGQEKLDSEQ
jgi:hypothetical protein